MSGYLNQAELKEFLTAIGNNLAAQGILDKNEVPDLVHQLEQENISISKQHLLDPEKRAFKIKDIKEIFTDLKALKDFPELKKDNAILEKINKRFENLDKEPENLETAKSTFKKMFKDLLKLVPKNKQKTDKELDDLADKYTKDLTGGISKKLKTSTEIKNTPSVDIYAEMMQSVSSLLGVDPRGGGAPRLVLAIAANYSGMISVNPGGFGNVMAELNIAQPGEPDATGQEKRAINNMISAGATTQGILDDVVNNISSMTPTLTKK